MNRIFEYYYPFILSSGTLVYLYFAMHPKLENSKLECSMSELEVNLNMSHVSIRKYEIILVMMGLLNIEVEKFNMYNNSGYEIKKKQYTVFRPLAQEKFRAAITNKLIPSFENAAGILPAIDTAKYQELLELANQLDCIANDVPKVVVAPFAVEYVPFKKERSVDMFKIERLFSVYSFLPNKVILFYLYLWRYWVEKDIDKGIHVPRKIIKKELGYGDEQIREAMYMLTALHLLDIEKSRYYRYYLKNPQTKAVLFSSSFSLRHPSAMGVLLPKDVFERKKYQELYEYLQYELKKKRRLN
jgi:hypothetical protein